MGGRFGYFPLAGDRLAAYDVESGALIWLVDAKVTLQPAVGADLVFIVESTTVAALSRQTGAVAWRVPLPDSLNVPLVFDNGWLIASTMSGTVLALRAADGGVIWRRELGVGLHARPALAADRVYLATTAGRVMALQVETGEVRWERRLGGLPNDILALDKRLYVGSTDKYLYAIDAAKGEIVWRWATGGDVVGAPVADNRNVYFVSFDNVLRALDLGSGVQRWKRPLPIRPTRGVVRVGDAVIVTGVTRSALAYSLKDGASVGDIAAGGELAAQPFSIEDAGTPSLVLVTQDFTDGTVVRAMKRSWEPPVAVIAPLPKPVRPTAPAGAAPPAGVATPSPTPSTALPADPPKSRPRHSSAQ